MTSHEEEETGDEQLQRTLEVLGLGPEAPDEEYTLAREEDMVLDPLAVELDVLRMWADVDRLVREHTVERDGPEAMLGPEGRTALALWRQFGAPEVPDGKDPIQHMASVEAWVLIEALGYVSGIEAAFGVPDDPAERRALGDARWAVALERVMFKEVHAPALIARYLAELGCDPRLDEDGMPYSPWDPLWENYCDGRVDQHTWLTTYVTWLASLTTEERNTDD